MASSNMCTLVLFDSSVIIHQDCLLFPFRLFCRCLFYFILFYFYFLRADTEWLIGDLFPIANEFVPLKSFCHIVHASLPSGFSSTVCSLLRDTFHYHQIFFPTFFFLVDCDGKWGEGKDRCCAQKVFCSTPDMQIAWCTILRNYILI